jgi:phosphohistidine swiveling domain-containing protein
LNNFDPIHGVWNDSYKGNFLWSATNLMEASPEVLTPFTASLHSYLDGHGGPSLSVKNYSLNGIIGGRFYANISVQVSAFARIFKGDAHRAYREISGWWGEIPENLEIPLIPLTSSEWSQNVLPGLLRSSRMFAAYRKKEKRFLAGNAARCKELNNKVKNTTTKEGLLNLWNQEIFPLYRDSLIHVVAAASDQQVKLERDLLQYADPDVVNALLSNLSGLSGQFESMGPAIGLGMILNGKMTREAYMEAYGHRGVNEGEAARPRPAEDPKWLDSQLEEWAKNPVNLDVLRQQQKNAFDKAWQRFSSQNPRQAAPFQKRILQAAKAAYQREAVRSEATRGMTVLRTFALRAGSLLGVADEIFYLTIDEVLELLSGRENSNVIALIPIRKETYQQYCALPPYPALICGRFDPFTWGSDPNRRTDVYDAQTQRVAEIGNPDHSDTLHGFAGALGIVEGTVRKLNSFEESSQFQTGEILVTTMTNIGWTPLFPRAAAIVTDLGAPLSHAAIVARELGIPAVVGCKDATMRLETGDRVRVDGGKGCVQILTKKE